MQSTPIVENKKVACFGELLLRLSPDTVGHCWEQQLLPAFIGGAELNVASALGAWGVPVKFITALPDNELRTSIEKIVRDRNVELEAQYVSNSRLGLYYLPQGADLKSAGVIYDRAHSAFAELRTGQINWREILADVQWLHLSAINPGLNQTLVDVCEEALQVADSLGIRISIDLNYRPKLWQYGIDPVTLMPRLLRYADYITGNIWAAEKLAGIPAGCETSAGQSDDELLVLAHKSAINLKAIFPKVEEVVYTFRLNDRYFSFGAGKETVAESRVVPIETVVDRAGSGDCFMAGWIFGKLNGYKLESQLNLGAEAAVQKMKEPGDATFQNIETLKQKAFQ